MDTQKLIVNRGPDLYPTKTERIKIQHINVDASLVDKRRNTTLSPAKSGILPATGAFSASLLLIDENSLGISSNSLVHDLRRFRTFNSVCLAVKLDLAVYFSIFLRKPTKLS